MQERAARQRQRCQTGGEADSPCTIHAPTHSLVCGVAQMMGLLLARDSTA